MPALDIFNQDAFSCMELTHGVVRMPNLYGRIGELGLFQDYGVSTTSVMIEMKDGILNLLPPTQRGGEATVNKSEKRRVVPIAIPNYTHADYILPDEVQNVRAFGSTSEMDTVFNRVAQKLQIMKNKHDITLEHLRAGAIQGQIRDDKGQIMCDLFEHFGVTENVVDFNFSSSSAQMDEACRKVSYAVEENLKGENMTYVHGLCDRVFFENLIKHPSMKEAYHAYQGSTPYRNDMRMRFEFQNLVFEVYIGKVSNASGEVFPLIPENTCRFFPMGTMETFYTYYAPGDFEETVNTIGLPYYAKQETVEFNRGRKLLTQSNPLPICLRPEILIKGRAA